MEVASDNKTVEEEGTRLSLNPELSTKARNETAGNIGPGVSGLLQPPKLTCHPPDTVTTDDETSRKIIMSINSYRDHLDSLPV